VERIHKHILPRCYLCCSRTSAERDLRQNEVILPTLYHICVIAAIPSAQDGRIPPFPGSFRDTFRYASELEGPLPLQAIRRSVCMSDPAPLTRRTPLFRSTVLVPPLCSRASLSTTSALFAINPHEAVSFSQTAQMSLCEVRHTLLAVYQ
jgi:hypothetical protein